MKKGAPEKLFENGKRLDGRLPEQMRPISLEVGILKNAKGSATFKFGDTFAIAGVYGPRPVHPRHFQNPQKAFLRCRYTMAPFSTKERSRPGPSRRSTEISKVITEAFENVIFLADYPRTGIDVFIEILQADASTRCAAINAISMALASAGIPMRDLICSCSVGKIDNQIIADLFGKEDNYGDVDLAVSTVGATNKFVHMQMDGIISKEELFEALNLAVRSCSEIYQEQVQALKSFYYESGIDENISEADNNE